MTSVRRALLLPLLAALVLTTRASAIKGCPFCGPGGKTLLDEVNEASLVVYGKVKSADDAKQTTRLTVESVVKTNPAAGKFAQITLDRYIDPDQAKKLRFLVFCEVHKDKIDAYSGRAFRSDSKVVDYVQKAIKVKDQTAAKKLRFFFDYLDHADIDVSNDAYTEYANAEYTDFKAMAKDLPAARVVKWLENPDTPSVRVGLYANMLGHCGKKADAKVLKKLLDDPERRAGSGIDGIMAAYTMLEPKAGWATIVAQLKDKDSDFLARFAALRAARFLVDFRSDATTKKQYIDGVCILLEQGDIADLAIEDLRKWKAWDRADKVLAVTKTDAYEPAIVKRAILRYCLQCKDNKAAEKYVADSRKEDAEAVDEALELLQLEADAAKPKDNKKDKPGKKNGKK
jgi:hypothetical protein